MTVSAPAFAAAVVPTLTPPADATRSLAVSVSGYITPKCTVDTKDSDGSFGDITNRRTGVADSVSLSLPFTMSCNSPYEAVLVSKNGALAYDGMTQSQFASTVDYSAALDMSRIAGGVALRCDSDAMRGNDGDRSSCRTNSANDVASATGDGNIVLKLKPGALPLLMGSYSDKLTLKLSPRV
ncbi:MAG: hypothetical protein M3R41_06175 [Pseudomonadota bacterium]|nr:hypothetical protein [Pseudomonadota bacterium]